jgi:dephospho-CoA kinase
VLLVGLTGGIGSGKTEVSGRLAALGAVVVDADVIAREVVEPGTPGLDQVVARFGPDVLDREGRLDRDRLAKLVFADPSARSRLNAIVHPLVRARTAELVAAAAAADPHAIVVNDVPLLVEAGLAAARQYDVIVVVAAEPETQMARLVGQRGMTEAEAKARMAAQAPLADKLAVADYVIRNDGDLGALDAEVGQVWAHLAARAGRTMGA